MSAALLIFTYKNVLNPTAKEYQRSFVRDFFNFFAILFEDVADFNGFKFDFVKIVENLLFCLLLFECKVEIRELTDEKGKWWTAVPQVATHC